MKKYISILIVIVAILALIGCSDDNDKKPNYQAKLETAWHNFETANYTEAIAGFQELIDSGELVAEAYNGLGWCNLYLDDLDAANSAFSNGLQNEPEDAVYQDIVAGLTFVYDAQNLPNACLTVSENVNPDWGFDHWTFSFSPLNYEDIIVLRAVSYYALGDFANSLLEVQRIDGAFTADVSTAEGRAALAGKIEELGG